MQPVAVVGDVHGDVGRLTAAAEHLHSWHGDVVLVGDYVNRGPGSRAVLQLLLDWQAEIGDRLHPLLGNHDAALLAFLEGGPLGPFVAHGGLSTVRSYLAGVGTGAVERFRDEFPPAHRDLLHELQLRYETDDVLVSHAGFDPADVDDRSEPAMCRGDTRIFRHAGPWPRPLTVCGHFVQDPPVPLVTEHLICLDTGCGTLPEGRLSVLFLPERRVVQF